MSIICVDLWIIFCIRLNEACAGLRKPIKRGGKHNKKIPEPSPQYSEAGVMRLRCLFLL